MKVSQIVTKKSIVEIGGLHKSKEDILSELVDVLYAEQGLGNEEVTREEVMEGLLARERQQSTAIGEGFAFPHARFPKVRGFYMAIGVCREGSDFDSMDQQPTHFFVINLVSQSKANTLLQARAAIMRFMMPEDVRGLMLETDDYSKVWKKLDESGVEVNNDILARDIMRPQVGVVQSDSTLQDAARLLHKYHVDSLPIVDENENFVGDISGFDLFSFGIPEFFFNLKKISFVKHMDPFEKYFLSDTTLKIADMKIKRKAPVISPDATIIEIVFELTAHDRQLVYVVEEGKLLGVIDRFSIVDKILVAEV